MVLVTLYKHDAYEQQGMQVVEAIRSLFRPQLSRGWRESIREHPARSQSGYAHLSQESNLHAAVRSIVIHLATLYGERSRRDLGTLSTLEGRCPIYHLLLSLLSSSPATYQRKVLERCDISLLGDYETLLYNERCGECSSELSEGKHLHELV